MRRALALSALLDSSMHAYEQGAQEACSGTARPLDDELVLRQESEPSQGI